MWNNAQGEFVRYVSGFRDWIRADGSTRFRPEAGRYHLYVSTACPWSHRTLIVRKARGLDNAISLSVVDPIWNESGWTFEDQSHTGGRGVIPDTVNGVHDLIDIYRMASPDFRGVESVPVLWDKRERTIVNNESREIMRMLDVELRGLGDPGVSFYDPGWSGELRAEIEAQIDALYPDVNNGVYRAGFATSQAAYERAARRLFRALDHYETVLASRPYLCGERVTEADICFFVTLVRFDLVYYSHFKCNLRRIRDYPALFDYARRLFALPGFGETCDFDHIKRHYYGSQRDINPTGIYPLGPPNEFTGS